MLGAEVRAIREQRGISVSDCARNAGVSASTLKKVESGERYPTLATLEKIAECLGVTFVIGPTETYIEPPS